MGTVEAKEGTAMPASLLSFCNEASATSARLLAYVGAVAIIAAVAVKITGLGVEAVVDPAARPEWITIERPHRAFALTLPEFPSEPEPGYAIQRHATGGGRKDVMSWGGPETPGSRLMIEVYRPGGELKPASDTTVSTADLGVVVGVKPAGTIDSKFGPLALVDFTVRRAARTRRCLGFARVFEEPRLQIAGWYCKGGDEVVDPALIACALDRLAVIAAGNDPKLAALFAQAELQRRFCQPKTASRGATLKRNDWIVAARDPKLRGPQAKQRVASTEGWAKSLVEAVPI
jgi:hypothetical protein